MILRGGFNVYPREIEEVLMTHPAVSLAAVIGVPDERLGEEVKAFVVPASRRRHRPRRSSSPGAASSSRPTSIHAWSSSATALPMTATGKILKRELRQLRPDARVMTPSA